MPTEQSAQAPPGHPDAARPGTRVFTSTRVEQLMARVLGIAVLIFGAQAFAFALMPEEGIAGWAVIAYRLFVFVPMIAVAVASAVQRGVRVTSVVFTIVYLLALVIWPFYSGFAFGGAAGEPWVWYLLTLATACAAVVYTPAWAVAYTIAAPVLFGVVRSLTPTGVLNPHIGLLDAVYGIIFGMIIVVLAVLFRQAARRVDTARDAALERYDRAVRAHAVEAERVEVDALVHDNVLAALQAAERAEGAEGERAAVVMAQRALDELRASGADPDPGETTVTLREMASRLAIAARMMEREFTVQSTAEAGVVLPQHVANAMGLAAVQAMVNSVQHADGSALGPDEASRVARTVSVSSAGGVPTVEVHDDGVGFEPASVPHDRLGLRVSISERMTTVGGRADVQSIPGDGTRIVLRWDPAEQREGSGA
ncbi:Signal transduction histidine kinase [Paramicrobacterium humi]|uniref:Signal transduction histidine kinase n=1 Tax=Paramicrobacterium humi TaxID=640635 RepID=A0A1H4ITB9_9MICO|nr:ATP-binding protein [Microbacterium humi]SEB37247.1 Signal transduction histidine kinase [Microbacterium humi]